MTGRWNLARTQAASGLVFAMFLVLHLATTASASGGIAVYDQTLLSMRRIYGGHPALEVPVVFLAGAVHLVAGLMQIFRRRGHRSPEKLSLLIRVHRWSGWYLAFAVGGHVFATRVLPWGADGGRADFSFLAFSVLNWPWLIDPYYVLLGLAGAVHLSIGVVLAAKTFLGVWLPSRGSRLAAAVVAGLLGLVVTAGVMSIIGRSPQAERGRFAAFRAGYGKYLPFFPQ
jgi:succinate dehydrogenase/fumarate reductase cytochrome b subunit